VTRETTIETTEWSVDKL